MSDFYEDENGNVWARAHRPADESAALYLVARGWTKGQAFEVDFDPLSVHATAKPGASK